MKSFYGSSFEEVLLRITDVFRKRVADKWMVLALGWVLQAGRKTVAGMIRAAGELGKRKSFAAFYKFFRTTSWDPSEFWTAIQRVILDILCSDRVKVVVDDTVLPKVGRRIAFCQWHREFHGRTSRDSKTVYGQKLVVLAVLWEQPFGVDVVISVPVMGRVLTDGTTPLRVGRQMLEHLERTYPKRTFIAIGDRFFGGEPFLGVTTQRETVEGLVRLKRNNALCRLPVYSGRGRPPDYGEKLPRPDELAHREDIEWESIEVQRYGRVEEVQVHTQRAKWPTVTGKATGRIIVVREINRPQETDSWIALYCTDPSMDPKEAIELYSLRWKIEGLFREAKQHGGLGEAQCRNPKAIRRQLAFVLGLISLVKVWFLQNYDQLNEEISRDGWENETVLPSFQIMMQKLRWTIRKKQFSQKMGYTPSSVKKISDLFDQWTRAA